MPVAEANPREAGEAALARAAWDEARVHLEQAVAAEEDSAAAWEALGWAAWWQGDTERSPPPPGPWPPASASPPAAT